MTVLEEPALGNEVAFDAKLIINETSTISCLLHDWYIYLLNW